MYCITSRSGQYLISLAADGPVFSPLPSEALATKNAWLSSSTATAKADEVARLFPGIQLNIGLLEMEGTSASTWRVTSTRSFPYLNTNAELIR